VSWKHLFPKIHVANTGDATPAKRRKVNDARYKQRGKTDHAAMVADRLEGMGWIAMMEKYHLRTHPAALLRSCAYVLNLPPDVFRKLGL
jgi:hypothetical protein